MSCRLGRTTKILAIFIILLIISSSIILPIRALPIEIPKNSMKRPAKPIAIIELDKNQGFSPLRVEIRIIYSGNINKIGLDFEGDGEIDQFWKSLKKKGIIRLHHTYEPGYYQPTVYVYTGEGTLENSTDLLVFEEKTTTSSMTTLSTSPSQPDFTNPFSVYYSSVNDHIDIRTGLLQAHINLFSLTTNAGKIDISLRYNEWVCYGGIDCSIPLLPHFVEPPSLLVPVGIPTNIGWFFDLPFVVVFGEGNAIEKINFYLGGIYVLDEEPNETKFFKNKYGVHFKYRVFGENNTLRLYLPDGGKISFILTETRTRQIDDTTYHLKYYCPTTLEDRSGNKVIINYNSTTISIIDELGREIEIEKFSNKTTIIKHPDNRHWKIFYNERRGEIVVQDPLGRQTIFQHNIMDTPLLYAIKYFTGARIEYEYREFHQPRSSIYIHRVVKRKIVGPDGQTYSWSEFKRRLDSKYRVTSTTVFVKDSKGYIRKKIVYKFRTEEPVGAVREVKIVNPETNALFKRTIYFYEDDYYQEPRELTFYLPIEIREYFNGNTRYPRSTLYM